MLPVSPDVCCGCGNCSLVCPKECISLKENDKGFLIPFVNNEICIDCGKCKKVCPVIEYPPQECLNHTAFAAYAKTSIDRFNGSSGGFFGVAAKYILQQKGIVYGAAFDDNLQLKTKKAEEEKDLIPLFKSKYLQCNTNTSFRDMQALLEIGKHVLYTATPCQIGALKKYLGRDYDNLLTIDFLCHGVPSQSFFDLCIDYVENKRNIKIFNYQFRAKKRNGATPHYYKIKYRKKDKDREKCFLYLHSPFYYGFQKYISLRESCYQCPFSKSNRPSDITIGDFHAIDKYVKGINRFDGVSTVIINTAKGKKFWGEIEDNFVKHSIDFPELIKNKELMCGPTQKPKEYEEFWQDFKVLPFEKFVSKHLNGNREWKKRVYYRLPKCARRLLKKLMGI